MYPNPHNLSIDPKTTRDDASALRKTRSNERITDLADLAEGKSTSNTIFCNKPVSKSSMADHKYTDKKTSLEDKPTQNMPHVAEPKDEELPMPRACK
jgi:hypothetical protein